MCHGSLTRQETTSHPSTISRIASCKRPPSSVSLRSGPADERSSIAVGGSSIHDRDDRVDHFIVAHERNASPAGQVLPAFRRAAERPNLIALLHARLEFFPLCVEEAKRLAQLGRVVWRRHKSSFGLLDADPLLQPSYRKSTIARGSSLRFYNIARVQKRYRGEARPRDRPSPSERYDFPPPSRTPQALPQKAAKIEADFSGRQGRPRGGNPSGAQPRQWSPAEPAAGPSLSLRWGRRDDQR